MELSLRRCSPCRKGDPGLAPAERDALAAQVPSWALAEGGRALEREFKFPSYAAGLAFAVRVGALADAEDHHPDLQIGYKTLRVRWTTHAVGGLSENDFICAAKTDALAAQA